MSAREPGRELECPCCADAAPYVLGALEDGETYRAHLDACPICRAEVAELQQAVDALPATAAPAAASQALRERVLATVRSEAELLQAAGAGAERPPRRASRGGSRRMPLLMAGVAVVAAVAVIAVFAGGSGTPIGERVTPAQIAAVAPGAHASLRQRDGRADLVVANMPPPPLGKIYEVWLSRGTGSPQPTDALFSVTSAGSGAVDVPYNLHGVREVLVTSEPLGGSSRPTSPPVIRVVLAT